MMNWIVLALAVVLAGPRTHERQETARKAEPTMAERRWVSTTGDLTAAASWNPSGVPVSTDILIWDGTVQTPVSTNAGALGAASVAPARWYFSPDYRGAVGTAADPLHPVGNLGTEEFIYLGRGEIYVRALEPALKSFFDCAGHVHLVDPAGPDVADEIYIRGATDFTIHASAACANVYLMDGPNGSPRLTVEAHATAGFGPLYMSGGTVDAHRNHSGTLNMAGGSYIQHLGQVTTLVQTAGAFEYRSADAISASATIYGGQFDVGSDPKERTIALLTLHFGAEYITHAGVTVTNLIDLRNEIPIFP